MAWDEFSDLDAEYQQLEQRGVVPPSFDSPRWDGPPQTCEDVADDGVRQFVFRMPGNSPQPNIAGSYALLMFITGRVPRRGDLCEWEQPIAEVLALVGVSVVWDQGALWRWSADRLLWEVIDLTLIRGILYRMTGCYTEKTAGKRQYSFGSPDWIGQALRAACELCERKGFFDAGALRRSDNSAVTGICQVGSRLYLASSTGIECVQPQPNHRQRWRIECELPTDDISGIVYHAGIPIDCTHPSWFLAVKNQFGARIWHDWMPNFMRLLDDILPDTDQQEVLRQMFGGCLFGLNVVWQMHLWCAGLERGRNGKGLITDILRMLLGEGNALEVDVEAARTMAYMRGGMERARLLVVSEASRMTGADAEWLKTPTGGGSIKIRSVGEKGFDARLPGMWLFSSNNLPTDALVGAIMRRLVVLSFEEEIPDSKAIDWPTLRARLLPEMPLIVAWALQGAALYISLPGLWHSKTSIQLKADIVAAAPTFGSWLANNLTYDPEGRITTSEIVTQYDIYRLSPRGKAQRFPPVNSVEAGRVIKAHLRRLAGQDLFCTTKRGVTVWFGK